MVYGVRGVGEYGLFGMLVFLGNSLMVVVEIELNYFLFISELIWRMKEGNVDDFI